MNTQVKPKLYSSTEAMEYLGMDWPTFRYHVYRKKYLKPDYKLGHNIGFLQTTLDTFKAKHFAAEGYSIKEAAKYLGVRLSWLRYHLFETKLLIPDGKRGRHFVFHKNTLDAMRMFLPPRQPPKRT